MATRQERYSDPRVAAAYDVEHAGLPVTTEDIPFYLDLAIQTSAGGLQVLELGCGTGRVTLPIAQRGVRITGLDSSSAMLTVAAAKAAGTECVRWLEGDMRCFRLDQRFGLVIIPFRSFSLLGDRERSSCLRCIGRHLHPGGKLALNLFNPDVLRALSRPGKRTAARRDGGGQGTSCLSRDEMERLLQAAAFEVEALYGWFDRRPFSETSSEMVLVARYKGGPDGHLLRDTG